MNKWNKVLFALVAGVLSTTASFAGEDTMPPPYKDIVSPELAAKYTYTEDGDYTKALGFPTYEWMPATGTPKAIVLAVHGLTLHGRRFRVLARTLAVNGIGFVSLDMRGFGRCHFGDTKPFSTPTEDRTAVDNNKSYLDVVALAQAIKQKYPDLRLMVMGESLGCSFAVRLAAEHPELANAIMLSAPAAKINPDMYAGHGQVVKGIAAVVRPSHEINMSSFFADLVSKRSDVQNEMIDDPFIRKKLTIHALLDTDEFVKKTEHWGKLTSAKLPVLILQGSIDGCVSAKHVTDLMNAMPSDDQSLAWRGNFGHLQLETQFMRAATIDAVADWLQNHSAAQKLKLGDLEQSIVGLGGTLITN
jgi:acylglycerol lipase